MGILMLNCAPSGARCIGWSYTTLIPMVEITGRMVCGCYTRARALAVLNRTDGNHSTNGDNKNNDKVCFSVTSFVYC